MDIETGQIHEFKDEATFAEALKTGKFVELEKKPNPSCHYCYGRGYTGFNATTHLYVPCKCVSPNKEQLSAAFKKAFELLKEVKPHDPI